MDVLNKFLCEIDLADKSSPGGPGQVKKWSNFSAVYFNTQIVKLYTDKLIFHMHILRWRYALCGKYVHKN